MLKLLLLLALVSFNIFAMEKQDTGLEEEGNNAYQSPTKLTTNTGASSLEDRINNWLDEQGIENEDPLEHLKRRYKLQQSEKYANEIKQLQQQLEGINLLEQEKEEIDLIMQKKEFLEKFSNKTNGFNLDVKNSAIMKNRRRKTTTDIKQEENNEKPSHKNTV